MFYRRRYIYLKREKAEKIARGETERERERERGNITVSS
jgi:hypothetical protein